MRRSQRWLIVMWCLLCVCRAPADGLAAQQLQDGGAAPSQPRRAAPQDAQDTAITPEDRLELEQERAREREEPAQPETAPPVGQRSQRQTEAGSKSLEAEFGERAAFERRGYVWNRFAHDFSKDDRQESELLNHLEIQFEGKYSVNQHLSFVIGTEANYFGSLNPDGWDHDGEIRLHNAYVHIALQNLNIRLGNQIVIWGKADEVSPLDNLNPEDLRDGFVRRRVERKLPVTMVNVDFSQDVHKLQAVFLPFFTRSQFDLRGTDWALFDQIEKQIGPFALHEFLPPTTLASSEAGLRFSSKIQSFDYAISYLYTREDTPSFGSLTVPPGFPPLRGTPTVRDLAVFAQATGQVVPLHYRRQHIVGFEFETVIGHIGLRGDIAYIADRSFVTRALRAVRKPVFQYIVGVDYNDPSNLYVNFQFSQSVIQDYDPTILSARKLTTEFNGTISKEFFGNDLKVALRYFYSITRSSYYLNPYVAIAYWKNLSIELGGDIIGGPRDTIFGLFRKNGQGYLTLKAFF